MGRFIEAAALPLAETSVDLSDERFRMWVVLTLDRGAQASAMPMRPYSSTARTAARFALARFHSLILSLVRKEATGSRFHYSLNGCEIRSPRSSRTPHTSSLALKETGSMTTTEPSAFSKDLDQLLAEHSTRVDALTKSINRVLPAFSEVIYPTLQKCAAQINMKMTRPCAEALESPLNTRPRWAALSFDLQPVPSYRAPDDPAKARAALRFEQAESGELKYGHVKDYKAKLGEKASTWDGAISSEWVSDQVLYFLRTHLRDAK